MTQQNNNKNSTKTYDFHFSNEKGFSANIGKQHEIKTNRDGERYADLLVFVTASRNEQIKEGRPSLMIHVHFPEKAFSKLESFQVGDLVRIYYERHYVRNHIEEDSSKVTPYIVYKASGIKLVHRANGHVTEKTDEARQHTVPASAAF